MNDNRLKDELKDYRQRIDITEYLTHQGYEVDKDRDSRKHRAYSHPTTGDKVYVPINKEYRNPSYYVSLYDPNDKGTVVDFVMSRQRTDLDGARQALKMYLGDVSRNESAPESTKREKQSSQDDEAKKRRQMFIVAKIVEGESGANEPFLENKLLGHDIRNHTAFHNEIKLNDAPDARFVAFPLKDDTGKVAGVAMKSPHKVRFLGNRDGLWVSSPTRPDTPVDRIVITEDPVDAMSHYQLHGKETNDNLVYLSPAGNPSNKQLEIANHFVLASGARSVTLANDDDVAGRRYDQLYKEALQSTNVPIHTDKSSFKDWNADLFAQRLFHSRLNDPTYQHPEQASLKDKIPAPDSVNEIVRDRDKTKYPELSNNPNLNRYYVTRQVDGKSVEFSLAEVAYVNRDRKFGKAIGTDIDEAFVAEQSSKSKQVAVSVDNDVKRLSLGSHQPSKDHQMSETLNKIKSGQEAIQDVDTHLQRATEMKPEARQSSANTNDMSDSRYRSLKEQYNHKLDGLVVSNSQHPDSQRINQQLSYYKKYPHLQENDVQKFVEAENVVKGNQLDKGKSYGNQKEQGL
ncbi:toprim domain-containing protein [Tunicatimonas pelagia]|uniref:toprim domain-containing protein n=1 Tax=Tunicatimonas pelagia TaxID=931531 RepID=UPI0026652369|nr:toprim domain-containing protein [Tunicatimonas pelagia]WKN46474.1 toprim domain-containing protein [Tunicatimonas pelagia]